MAKRRVKKNIKQPASPPPSNLCNADSKELPVENKENAFTDQDVERQSAAIRTIRDAEIDRLLTGLRLLRFKYSKEQQQIPALQFFAEYLPDLAIIKTGKEQYEVRWKDKDGDLSMYTGGGNIHNSLFQWMSKGYPNCPTAMQSFGGFEFSSEAVKAILLGADSLHTKDFVLEEQFDTQILGLQDSLQTPGVTNQRLSVVMTPKTLRLPKHGEMLLSVHGSPLGVFKEDNMEAIHETEEAQDGE